MLIQRGLRVDLEDEFFFAAFCVTRNATDCHVFVGMVRQVKVSSNWFGYIFKIHVIRMIDEILDVEPVKIGYA